MGKSRFICHSVKGTFSCLLQGSHLHRSNSFATIKHAIQLFTSIQHQLNCLNHVKCLHQAYESFPFILNNVLIFVSSLKPLCAQSNSCCVPPQELKKVILDKSQGGKGVRMYKICMSCSCLRLAQRRFSFHKMVCGMEYGEPLSSGFLI